MVGYVRIRELIVIKIAYSNKKKLQCFSIFFALLLIAVIISTIVDVLTREGSKNTNKMAQIFSAYANTEYLLADNFDKENQTNCLDGFRAISMLYVLFGHRFIMLLFFPTTNGLEITEVILLSQSHSICTRICLTILNILVAEHLC